MAKMIEIGDRSFNPAAVDFEELGTLLAEAEVKVPKKASRKRLLELAIDKEITIPEKEIEEQEEEVPAGKRGNVVPPSYRQKYGAPQNCGDEIAQALRDALLVPKAEGSKTMVCDPDKLAHVATQNDVDLRRWESLNIGMKRMNLGNVLRGMVNKGLRVEIYDMVWEAREVEKEGEKLA